MKIAINFAALGSETRVNIDPYVATLFGKKASKKQFCIDAALNGLFGVIEHDESQRRTASALLFRANQARLITAPLLRARYERLVMPPPLKRPPVTDKPAYERSGPPSSRLAKLAVIRQESSDIRTKMKVSKPGKAASQQNSGGKKAKK